MIRLAINGASGRMGRRLIALSHGGTKFKLVSAVCSTQSTSLGMDAGNLAGIGPIGLALTDRFENNPQIVVDFSSPTGAAAALEFCADRQIPLVLATTGLERSLEETIGTASHRVPICAAPNMSLAVNLTMKLAQVAANSLSGNSSGVDVEIIERHHRFKADAPSGTALRFGKLIAEETSVLIHNNRNAIPQSRQQHYYCRHQHYPGGVVF